MPAKRPTKSSLQLDFMAQPIRTSSPLLFATDGKPLPWLLAIVTLGGALLRFSGLGQPSLWLDEILHVTIATQVSALPWHAWLFGFGFEVENGALFYAGQLLPRAFAEGETAVRLAPALAGTLTIPLLGLAGRALGGPAAGVAAALLLAVSPFHVYFSREGRVYALIMLVAALLLWIFLRRPRPASRLDAVLPAAGCVLAAYTGAAAGPLLVAAGAAAGLLLASAWYRRRGEVFTGYAPTTPIRRRVELFAGPLLGLALVAVLYLGGRTYDPEPGTERGQTPEVTHVLSRAAATRAVTALGVTGRDETELVPLAAVWLGLAVFGLLATVRRDPRAGTVLASFVLVGLIASFGALHYMDRWFLVRYLAPVLPAYVLAVAAGAVELGRLAGVLVRRAGAVAARVVAAATLAAVLVGLGLPALANARREPYLKADWRGAAEHLAALARPGETVIVSNGWGDVCLRYYLGPRADAFEIRDVAQRTDAARELVEQRDVAWLVTGGYHVGTDIPTWVRGFHPVFDDSLEGLAVTFHPDLRTLVETREGRPCAPCAERLAASGGRLDFDGRDAFFYGAGWQTPERRPDGEGFRWIRGRHAELALPALPAGGSLRLEANPLVYPGAPPQSLELRLDGEPIGELSPEPGWGMHTIALPEDLPAAGLHLLTLDLAHAVRPRDVIPGSTDKRSLGLAVAALEVTP